MAQYEELIAVSIKERQHAIKLATADLDRLLDQLKATEAVLSKLEPNSERMVLLLRVRARLSEVMSLRRERVTRVVMNVIVNPVVDTVGKYRVRGTDLVGPLTDERYLHSTNSYMLMVGRMFGLDTSASSAETTPRKPIYWRQFVRKMCVARYFASLHRRACASRRARSIGVRPDQTPKPTVTRSAAAQSRLVAPISAPPAFC
ncbi:hypothetical protein [Paraburkholderia sp. EG304]|uniref:hypothetical protein n=1 Tax=Paraburkholderia sp. EG304 TaxID=3237015 RepID=UPI00397BD69F